MASLLVHCPAPQWTPTEYPTELSIETSTNNSHELFSDLKAQGKNFSIYCGKPQHTGVCSVFLDVSILILLRTFNHCGLQSRMKPTPLQETHDAHWGDPAVYLILLQQRSDVQCHQNQFKQQGSWSTKAPTSNFCPVNKASDTPKQAPAPELAAG